MPNLLHVFVENAGRRFSAKSRLETSSLLAEGFAEDYRTAMAKLMTDPDKGARIVHAITAQGKLEQLFIEQVESPETRAAILDGILATLKADYEVLLAEARKTHNVDAAHPLSAKMDTLSGLHKSSTAYAMGIKTHFDSTSGGETKIGTNSQATPKDDTYLDIDELLERS